VEEDLMGFQEAAGLLNALSIPFIIVISKLDMNTEGWSSVAASLACYGKPIFAVSATSGHGVPELISYLSRYSKDRESIEVVPRDASVFVIESVKASEEVGLVAKGAMMQGRLDLMSSGSNAWRIGPMPRDGAFLPVSIVSIHRLRLPVHEIEAELMAAVALSSPCQVTRGMLLVHNADTRRLTGKTTGHIDWRGYVLITGSPVPEREMQGILHCGCARVPVKARLGPNGDGLEMDILEGGRVLVLAGMKMVLLTNSYIAAGLYNPSAQN
jgi:GTPase